MSADVYFEHTTDKIFRFMNIAKNNVLSFLTKSNKECSFSEYSTFRNC